MATNFEFYKDQILEIAKIGSLAVCNDKPVSCGEIQCTCCLFKRDEYGCAQGRELFEWLYAEHIEAPKLTKRGRAFCEAVQTGWIARDECGGLYFYEEAPTKHGILWSSNSGIYELPETIWELFSFAKWEDEKPWSVEDLLKLEVEECNTSET